MDLYKLKFPIGEFKKPDIITPSILVNWIDQINQFPYKLSELVENLSVEELNWVYRPKGWTIKQVVHHCGDSHMNSLIRFKLSLTENSPVIKPYLEDKWAELPDSQSDDIQDSLLLIKSLHAKWTMLLTSLTPQQLEKTFTHPEHGETISLKENIGIYAWHCAHHLAHVKQALEAKGVY